MHIAAQSRAMQQTLSDFSLFNFSPRKRHNKNKQKIKIENVSLDLLRSSGSRMKALDSSREFTSKCIEIIERELLVVYADSSNATVQKFSCEFVETFPYPAKRANEHTRTLGQRKNTDTGSASFVNCLFVRSTFFNTLVRRVVDASNTVPNTPPIAFATFHTNNFRVLHLPSISEYSAIGQHSHVALRCCGAHISTVQTANSEEEKY